MNIAFDYGDTLEVSPGLLELAKALEATGHGVTVISAVDAADDIQARIDAIVSLGFSRDRVQVFDIGQESEPLRSYLCGQRKAILMIGLGAVALIDDNDHVCKAVADSGLIALKFVPAGMR